MSTCGNTGGRTFTIGKILLIVISAVALDCVCGHAAIGQENSIPFQLQDNLVVVPITLDGSQAEGVLDSGTGSLGVDPAFAASLGLQLGKTIGMVPGGGAPEPMFPVTIAKIEFGPERLTHVAGVALDLGHISSSAGFPVRLLLGHPVFELRGLRIDYPGRQIRFLPAGKEVECADPIPLTFFGGAPVVAVTLRVTPASQPRTLHLIVDMGTRHYAAMLGGPFLDTAEGKELEAAGKSAQVGTGTGGAVMGTSAQVTSLAIGTHEFPGLRVALTRHIGAFAAGMVDGSLGVPIWVNGTVTFDYPHQKLCFDLAASHRE